MRVISGNIGENAASAPHRNCNRSTGYDGVERWTMPEPAVLLRDFVNTFDVGTGADDLDTPSTLARWLTERGLLPSGAPAAGPDELTMAVTLREGLRAAMLGHQGPVTPPFPAGLDRVLAGLPLRVTLVPGGAALVPAANGVAAGLAALAAAVMDSVADRSWPRLKACQEETCHVAFIDTSKNRSRAWCSMQLCGNRTKTRAYRARRRSAADRHL
jgi:predicted RNA-binding Zn ribbon-like protein